MSLMLKVSNSSRAMVCPVPSIPSQYGEAAGRKRGARENDGETESEAGGTFAEGPVGPGPFGPFSSETVFPPDLTQARYAAFFTSLYTLLQYPPFISSG